MAHSKSSFQSFARLFSYTKKHRRDFYLGSLFSFLNKAFDIAPEILIGIAIDVVANQEKSFLARWGVEEPGHQLILLSVLTLLIWMCESLFEYLLLLKWRGLAQSLQHEFRTEAYDHLQRLDMSFFEDRSTGGLVSILNDDINQLERFLNGGMNSLIQVFTSVILIGAVFFALAPSIAIFAFLPIPVILWGAFYFQKRAAPLYLDVREKAGQIGSRLANNISGMATIRSFTSEQIESKKVANDSMTYLQSNKEAIKVSSAFNPLIRMAVLMGFIATFIMGGQMALRGELNVGFYGVLVFLTQRLLWPLTGLADTVDLFERAMASADRVLDLIKTPVNLESTKAVRDFDHTKGIEFSHLDFAYSNGVQVLKDINIRVPAGKTVAIVGPTGSGKSTVTKLLLGFYKPSSGKILFGGQDTADCDPQDLRSQIGLVSQDVFLFHGSIYENIAYGSPGASRDAVLEAARKAHAMEFIEKLPEGLDTLIGERGQKLSGGQRQRISIARVILKNPPVLILDEATSAVDNETEAVIQASLAEATKGRTTIVIAHRLSTVTQADNIYVVAQGGVVESGTHQELLQNRKMYFQLWTAPL
ncbi:ABC transporter ATP-binding protein [Bdellovibrio bacteriovorus]|uniref:ABC transporter ATP-binding protein n=1 Tax=Bdellovibrio bacteriovorus (strain ATCC 15356 / DSM 50701 / NCIMB 9529 / HD100) TaxID=264462 RepID=Q6MMU4_BDEBA|nr:ABC transporter ATP-binding protein [Bdellovibrio bacteriovorus]CAE79409.1 ABC transporter ATP-binding protein [Bdellovibrio bacteriovorus HD100]